MKNTQPLNQHPAIVRFGRSVARLIKPSLPPLFQVVVDVKQGIQEERSELISQMNVLRLEGYEAAAGLSLPHDGIPINPKATYFDRIAIRRGNRDE